MPDQMERGPLPLYAESGAWNHETREEDPLVIIRGDAGISRMAAEFLVSWHSLA
jgi:hypothetical protein